ncbi:MAG: hypothetical protein ACTSO9_10390 [Candidatus Helarchaeota archaeon]
MKTFPYDYTKWSKQLKNANIPQEERLKILKNGGNLINSGVKRETVEKIIQKVIKSSEFRALFIKNPKDALLKLDL